MSVDWTSLKEVLVWLVSGTGAGVVMFALWEVLEKAFPGLGKLNALAERIITLAGTVLMALGAYGIQVGLQYRIPPGNWVEVLEQVFSIAAMAIISALAIHGIKQERKA